MDDKLQLKLSYQFNAFLMHLIQDVTKRSSSDIMNFFHELGQQVGQIGMEKRTGERIDKKITDYFPGTSVPFYMRLKGSPERGMWNPVTRLYEHGWQFYCSVEVTFPEERTYTDDKLLNEISVQLMEKALLGVAETTAIEPFKRPEIRSGKMYKGLLDTFMGRPPKERKAKKKTTDDPS